MRFKATFSPSSLSFVASAKEESCGAAKAWANAFSFSEFYFSSKALKMGSIIAMWSDWAVERARLILVLPNLNCTLLHPHLLSNYA